MNHPRARLGRLAAVVSVVLVIGFVTVPTATAAVSATTTTMSGDASSVEFGERLTLSGRVTSGGSGLANHAVIIERRPVGGTWRDWTTVATVRTDEAGDYSRSWTPGSSGEYRGRVAETSTHGSSFSSPVRVAVTRPGPAATSMTIGASPSGVEFGERLTLSGRVTSGGSGLANHAVIIERRPVGGTWRDWSAAATVRTDSSGSFTRSWTPGSSGEYRGRIAGTSAYASSFSNAVRVAVTRPAPARTSVTIAASASSVTFGNRATLSGRVSSGGDGLANRSVIIELRPVGGTWRDWRSVATVRTDSSGNYSRSWSPGSSGEYRARITGTSAYAASFSTAATIRVTGKPSSGPTATSTSLSPAGAPFRPGESVWFTGVVRGDGQGIFGKVVTIDRRSVGGSTWTPVVTARTNGSGRYTALYRPPATYEYRARISGTSNWAASSSAVVRAASSSGNRTLAQRADVLSSVLGSTAGPAESFTRGSSTVTYRRYDTALLVEVASGSSTRTWAVRGGILSKYLDMGGPRGDLGPPVADAKCVLLESGCVQRFAGGTIYDNANVSAVATSVTGRPGELIAAGLSQVGYSTSVRNGSKYNRWVGTSNAWCSIYLSWASEASGNKNLLPTRGNFPAFHSAMLTRTRVAGPRVGAIAFFDTRDDGITRATHAGLVMEVRGSTIITLEGNTTNPSTGACCGVYIKQRSASHPMYYYMPDY